MDQIRKTNGSPHISAAYKYRNSTRLFAVLDAQLHHSESVALRVKHETITRALEHPKLRRRCREGLPDPVLTRAAISYRELRVGLGKSLAMLWVVFKMTVLSHFNDVPIWPRLVHILRFIVLQIGVWFPIWTLRRLGKAHARWLG